MDRTVYFKEWRPLGDKIEAGAEKLRYGFLRPLQIQGPKSTYARIENELRKGRIINTFADMTLLVLGPHHDSPQARFYDEDMRHYARRFNPISRAV